MRGSTLRKDARGNRDRLIAAAKEMFQSQGFGIPLEDIAQRAQISRATLYRNFPDRRALLAAVIADDVARAIEHGQQAPDDDRAIFHLMKGLAELGLVYAGLDDEMKRELALEITEARMAISKACHGPMERAQQIGLLRADLTMDELLLAVEMIACVVERRGCTSGRASFDEAIALLTVGIGGRRTA